MFKQTKKALMLSVLMLVVCLSMLLGTTYAWFTDSASSGSNVIQVGNLDAVLEYKTNWSDEWAPVDENTKIFKEGALYEPGYTEVVYLRVSNAGSLALKYLLSLNLANEKGSINVNGEKFKLSDYLQIGWYVQDEYSDGFNYANILMPVMFGTSEAALQKVNLQKLSETKVNICENTPVLPGNETAQVVAIVLTMPETVGNEANTKFGEETPSIELGVRLFATQLSHEEDSFGKDYDKDVEYGISTASDLVAALNNGGTYRIEKDIEFSNAVEIPEGVEVTLDLNGKTLSGTAIKQRHTLVNNGTLTIMGGTIASTGDDGGSAIVNKGTLTAKNVTINGAPWVGTGGVWYPSYAVNNSGTMTITDSVITAEHGGVAATGGTVTLNNVKVTVGKDGKTNAALYTSGGKIIVNGGTYTNRAIDQNSTGASVVNGNVEITAGTFNGRIENYFGTPVIKGGTFSVNPTRFVKGYEVVDNANGTWTVHAYEVGTGRELADAIAAGKAVELTQDINLGKIDLTGASTNDVVINANGHKITTTDSYGIEVTPGKNITISNAEVVMTKEGDYITYAAGFKIANGDYTGSTITLENCTITMANTDWAYAINMPASVTNLNLVINNCTLEGAVAVQCWGDNNTVTITNSKLICNYTTSALYTSYCVAIQDNGTTVAENNTFVIDNCEFEYSGIDNFNSNIYAHSDISGKNTVTITNCTYGEKVVAG